MRGTDRKHVLIGGGSGFISTTLKSELLARGDDVTIISRNAGPGAVTWDDLKQKGLPVESGYAFRFPDIDSALADLVKITL